MSLSLAFAPVNQPLVHMSPPAIAAAALAVRHTQAVLMAEPDDDFDYDAVKLTPKHDLEAEKRAWLAAQQQKKQAQ